LQQKLTPTCVGLVTGEKVRDALGESLAGTVYATFEVSSGLAKRKMYAIDRKVRDSGDIVGGEIKGGTQVFDDMDCVLCERERERFAKSELMVFVNAVRIRLSDKLV